MMMQNELQLISGTVVSDTSKLLVKLGLPGNSAGDIAEPRSD